MNYYTDKSSGVDVICSANSWAVRTIWEGRVVEIQKCTSYEKAVAKFELILKQQFPGEARARMATHSGMD